MIRIDLFELFPRAQLICAIDHSIYLMSLLVFDTFGASII